MNTMHYIVLGAKSPTGRQYLAQLGEAGIKAEQITAIEPKPSSMSFGENDVIPVFEPSAYKNNTNRKNALVILAEDKPQLVDIADTHLDDEGNVLDLTGHFIDDPDAVYAPQTGKLVIQPSPIARAVEQLLARLPVKPLSLHLNLLLPTSYFGKDAMDELYNQVRQFLVTDDMDAQVFDKKIAFNVIPQAGYVIDNGQSSEEHRIQTELSKLCPAVEKIHVNACIVPVFTGISAHLTLTFDDRAPAMGDVTSALRKDTMIRVIGPDSDMHYATPAEIIGDSLLNISRLARDPRNPETLSMWLMLDHTQF